jgi:hypothetical protein
MFHTGSSLNIAVKVSAIICLTTRQDKMAQLVCMLHLPLAKLWKGCGLLQSVEAGPDFFLSDSEEAPKRVFSAAPDAVDARFTPVLMAARIHRLLMLLSLSLLLNLLHFFFSKLNGL